VIKLLLGAIDSSYDTKDEKQAQGQSFQSQQGGYGQPPQGQSGGQQQAVTASNKEVTDSNKAVTASSSREATVNHRHSKVAMVVLHRPSPDTRLNKVVVSRVGTVLRRHHQDID